MAICRGGDHAAFPGGDTVWLGVKWCGEFGRFNVMFHKDSVIDCDVVLSGIQTNVGVAFLLGFCLLVTRASLAI